MLYFRNLLDDNSASRCCVASPKSICLNLPLLKILHIDANVIALHSGLAFSRCMCAPFTLPSSLKILSIDSRALKIFSSVTSSLNLSILILTALKSNVATCVKGWRAWHGYNLKYFSRCHHYLYVLALVNGSSETQLLHLDSLPASSQTVLLPRQFHP